MNTLLQVYYQYSDESPIVMIKGEATVNTSVSNLLDFLHSYGDTFDSNMQVLDAMCTGAQAVDVLDAKHKVSYGYTDMECSTRAGSRAACVTVHHQQRLTQRRLLVLACR